MRDQTNQNIMSLPIHICLRRMTVTSMDEDSNPLPRFKFGSTESANKLYQLLSLRSGLFISEWYFPAIMILLLLVNILRNYYYNNNAYAKCRNIGKVLDN